MAAKFRFLEKECAMVAKFSFQAKEQTAEGRIKTDIIIYNMKADSKNPAITNPNAGFLQIKEAIFNSVIGSNS